MTACYSFDSRTWRQYSRRQLEEWKQQWPGKDLFVAPPPSYFETRRERHKAHRTQMHREAVKLLADGASIDFAEVKALRGYSGSPIMECRDALIVAEGDRDKALEMLLIKSAELSVGVR